MKRTGLGRLLWFDCTAAAVGGTAMLALSGVLAPLLGLARALLVFNGVVNLVYASYSFSLARQGAPARGRVRALVAGNLAWAGVCAVVALHFARAGVGWGAAYLLGEGLFVGVLAGVEARALAATAPARSR